MLNCYVRDSGGLRLAGTDASALGDDTVWVDLWNPTPEEDEAVETRYGVCVPTGDEMWDLETSSRLHVDQDQLHMTATIATKIDTPSPETAVLTFILSSERLISVRYSDPIPFRRWRAFAEKHPATCATPTVVFTGLMQSLIERIAEVLERLGGELDALSTLIFSNGVALDKFSKRDQQLRSFVQSLGRKGDLLSKLRESLVSLGRTLSFAQGPGLPVVTPEARRHLQTVQQDVIALSEHASFVAGKISFLLEATLGLISIEQNRLMNIFSIAAVVLMPPTLIAGIYGMNFEIMPELKWHLGYPLSLLLMLMSSVLPLLYLRRRGYL